jgi:hypothetical protein
LWRDEEQRRERGGAGSTPFEQTHGWQSLYVENSRLFLSLEREKKEKAVVGFSYFLLEY